MTSACKIQAVWPVAGPPLTSPWPLTFWPWKWCPTHVWRGLLKTVSTNLLSSANWITYCSNIFAIPSSISLMNIRNNKGPNHVCNFLWRSVKSQVVWAWQGVEFPISPLSCVVALTTLSHSRASVWFITIKGKKTKKCKVDNYHTTKTAKIEKKVILLCYTSPLCQCSAE